MNSLTVSNILWNIIVFFLNVNNTFPIALFLYQLAFSSFYLAATVFGNSNSLAASGRTYRSFSKPIFSYLGLTASPISTERRVGRGSVDSEAL